MTSDEISGTTENCKITDLLEETFSQKLMELIDQSGRSYAEIYGRANVDRRHFFKIKNNVRYRPTKRTVFAFIIALELPIKEAEELLLCAGFAFTRSSKQDIIVRFFIDSNLKELISTTVETMDKAGELVGMETSVGKAALANLVNYLMYLSSSDGQIKPEEVRFISDVADAQIPAERMAEYIRENNIYSTEFENDVPIALQFAVKLDNELYKRGLSEQVNNTNLSEVIMQTFGYAGKALMQSDGDIDDNEKSDFMIYMGMMNKYIKDNLLCKNGTANGPEYDNDSIPVPPKNGWVEAPRKA